MKTGRLSAFNLYIFLILFAFEILMSFTFLGYVHIYPLSVTFAYIPILIAACLLGPAESTVMGFVFGLASAYKSSAFYVMPADRLFSPFLSGNFLGSVMLAIGARTLFGLAAGMYYKAAKQAKRKDLAIGAVTLISPTVHAFIVIFMMGIFFPNEAKSEFFSPYLVISNAVSSLFCVLILELFWKLFNHSFIKKDENRGQPRKRYSQCGRVQKKNFNYRFHGVYLQHDPCRRRLFFAAHILHAKNSQCFGLPSH